MSSFRRDKFSRRYIFREDEFMVKIYFLTCTLLEQWEARRRLYSFKILPVLQEDSK